MAISKILGSGIGAVNAPVEFTSADNLTQLTLSSTDTDANIGPRLDLTRNSSNPADNDYIGQIRFMGEDTADNSISYVSMFGQIIDVTDGTEDGSFELDVRLAGTNVSRMISNATETIFNDDSVDLDFRVESNGNANMIFVEGSTDRVGIGTGSPSRILTVSSTSQTDIAITAGTSSSAQLCFGDSDDDNIGQIEYNNSNNYMAFSANTAEVFRINTDGNFGIGNAIPSSSYKFQAQSTANQIVALTYNSNASFTQDLHAWDTNKAGNTNFNFFRARTNVGGTPDSEMILQGSGGFAIDGTVTENGADYAEYFEWKDGNSDSEDRVGITVKLDGDKIVPSTSDDNASVIIGVISGKPSIVGDSAWNKWQNKHETDDYGRYVWEEYTFTEWTIPATDTEDAVHHSYPTDYIPSDLTAPSNATVVSKDGDGTNLMRRKLNSSYNPSTTYIPREQRPEWDAVGMMGKLRIRKGQTVGDRWIKMRDISSSVEEWLVK